MKYANSFRFCTTLAGAEVLVEAEVLGGEIGDLMLISIRCGGVWHRLPTAVRLEDEGILLVAEDQFTAGAALA